MYHSINSTEHNVVRTQLLAANPPTLNNIPLGYIVGELNLNKAQYERQLEFGRSFYVVYGEDIRIFIGNKGVSEDRASAVYYWHMCWIDAASADHESYWTTRASKAELLDYALKRVQNLRPDLQELIKLTPVEGIMPNAIRVRDMVPEDLPRGRVTLLGDAIHPMTQCKYFDAHVSLH